MATLAGWSKALAKVAILFCFFLKSSDLVIPI